LVVVTGRTGKGQERAVTAWEQIATDPIVTDGLGILCAAAESLTIDELATVAGWGSEADRQAFLRGARELLVETQRTETTPAYQLYPHSIRAQVAQRVGVAALRRHHRALAQKLAT
jgi:hypothetical protein